MSDGRAKSKDGRFSQVDLYNQHEGMRGRDGGPYLDEVEKVQAERTRQTISNSEEEPNADLSGSLREVVKELPAGAGTPLVTKARVVDNTFSNPSAERRTNHDFDSKPVQTVDILRPDAAYEISTADTTGHAVIPHEPGDKLSPSGEVTKWEDRKPLVNKNAEVASTSGSMANPLNAMMGDTSTLATTSTPGAVTAGESGTPNTAGDYVVVPEDEDSGEDQDPTNEELREQLREKGLPVSGNKAELIARLEENK